MERLKDDPILYVRRSVANNLNDIAKDHPMLTIETCRRWAVDASEGRTWIIRHALRSLVKAGNKDAICILGGTKNPSVHIDDISITPQRVSLGEAVRLSFEMKSTAPEAQRLLIDYAVHFVKANGGTRPKVFKLRTLTLQPNEKTILNAIVSFAKLKTRRHYPGRHHIDVLINGEPYPLGDFELTP